MKILVTGGAGFIGSHVVDTYIKAGHRVVVLDNLKGGKLKNVNKKAFFVKMDIRDKKGVGRLFNRHKFEVVNNHAAQMSVPDSVKDPLYDADVNVKGVLTLLENARRTKVKKFIQVSSGGTVYGTPKLFPTKETHPIAAESPYGITKAVAENYLRFYHLEYGMKYSVVRYANVYGPRQLPHGEAGVVAIFILAFMKGKVPTIFGKGKVIRDYVYVGDVAAANLKVLRKGHNEAFNIGTGVPTDLNKLFKVIAKEMGYTGKANFGPPRVGDLAKSYIDASKAKRKLGWKVSTDFAAGVKATADFFRNKGR